MLGFKCTEVSKKFFLSAIIGSIRHDAGFNDGAHARDTVQWTLARHGLAARGRKSL